jgi:hypothetical protein
MEGVVTCNPTAAYAGHTWYSRAIGPGEMLFCYSTAWVPASYNNTNSDQERVGGGLCILL